MLPEVTTAEIENRNLVLEPLKLARAFARFDFVVMPAIPRPKNGRG
jgi:hypothetical protein